MIDQTDNYSESIVLTLLKRLENTGRTIYFNSWYSSFSLYKKLTYNYFKFIFLMKKKRKDFLEENVFNNCRKYVFQIKKM